MKFKVGQIIKLKKGKLSRGYGGAMPGHRAKVVPTRSHWHGITIKWIDKSVQGNGGYLSCDFELVGPQQLLFSFMYEKDLIHAK